MLENTIHLLIDIAYLLSKIRRPLPRFGLGGAALGITVGVRHGPVPALASKARSLSKAPPYGATLKASKAQSPPQHNFRHLCHGTSLRSTSCFYWVSKLLHGTFWARFQSFKSSKPSAAAFEGSGPALPWYLPRPHKLFLLGFETGARLTWTFHFGSLEA